LLFATDSGAALGADAAGGGSHLATEDRAVVGDKDAADRDRLGDRDRDARLGLLAGSEGSRRQGEDYERDDNGICAFGEQARNRGGIPGFLK
jgi:hypothetical protein